MSMELMESVIVQPHLFMEYNVLWPFEAPPASMSFEYSEHGGHEVQNLPCKREGYGGGFKFEKEVRYGTIWHEAKYISQHIIMRNFTSMPSLRSLNLVLICSSYSILETLEHLRNLPGHWSSSIKKIRSDTGHIDSEPSKVTADTGCPLPYDLLENILQRLQFENLLQLKILSKAWKNLIDRQVSIKARSARREGTFTAIYFYIENNEWRCTGFDLQVKRWRPCPPFSPALPLPEAELFKEYSLHSHDGLMCVDAAKLPERGELVVFNLLTRKTFQLPRLLYPRTPVLLHISVNPATQSYQVIAAGSSTARDEHLSKKMEVFDSETSKWEEAPDIPGPLFGLNEHQAGVTINGILHMITFLEGDGRRGVVAYDLQKKKWLDTKRPPIPFSSFSNTLQLLESDGELVLFSEQEQSRSVYHCIDVLVEGVWRNVIRVRKGGGRGLQVYPEHVCVPFGAGKVCVFDALNRDGVVYDVKEGRQVDVLERPSLGLKGEKFFTLNPTSFMLQPRFDVDPSPKVSIQPRKQSVGDGRPVAIVQGHTISEKQSICEMKMCNLERDSSSLTDFQQEVNATF